VICFQNFADIWVALNRWRKELSAKWKETRKGGCFFFGTEEKGMLNGKISS
jgi:hypothetical protein